MSGQETKPREVHLFRNGRNQAVRIPRDLELKTKRALIYREAGRLILEPLSDRGLSTFLDSLEPVPHTLPDMDEGLQPLDDVEL